MDTDDGSSYLLQDFNVFAYGANGLKNDFGGHDNHHQHNMYLFVDACWGEGFAAGHPDGTANNDIFASNQCLLKVGGWYGSDCGNNPKGFQTHNNSIYTSETRLALVCFTWSSPDPCICPVIVRDC